MEEELGERLVAAFNIAVSTREEVKASREDIRSMHSDLKGEIREMRGDLKGEMRSVGERVSAMHTDMNRSFQEMALRYDAISAELVRTREELRRSVDALLELINEFIRERREASGRKAKE